MTRIIYLFLLLTLLLFTTACEFGQTSVTLPTTIPTANPLPIAVSPAITPLSTSLPVFTPLPVASPLPTATYNPQLADWTVLVYMNGDNNLERAALLDLNEMEAAGSSKQVNVLVQLDRAVGETAESDDWTDTRRYLIRGDADPTFIASEPLLALGEANMGDPNTLADFITWGIRTYPANHYALVLWDHGAGWSGVSFDSDTADYGQPDSLSLPDLSGALAQALAQTNLPRLDVIAFDACLMAQLDVFQAVQPFARYAVASQELTPGQGWEYQTVLGHLYASPQMGAADFARQLVTDFKAYYTLTAPDDFVTMSAVDLAQLPQLTNALDQLAISLMPLDASQASAIGDARSGAEAYGRVYAEQFERYGAIDLHHFATILGQRSPDPLVKTAVSVITAAIQNSIIALENGAGFNNSHGIAIYFPPTAAAYTPSYASTTALKPWSALLNNYYTTTTDELPAPEIRLTHLMNTTANAQNPAYLEFEIVGRDIENVRLLGGRYEEDGRRRLLEYDTLIPEPTYLPDGSQMVEWRDGVHQDFFIWDTKVTYLYDAAGNGDFAVMWPTELGSSLFTVQGQFRRADSGVYYPANLVFDHQTGQLTAVWSLQSPFNEAPAELLPNPGDEFQLTTFYLDTINTPIPEPGPSLFFDENRQLYFTWYPLPDGNYFLGFRAENVAGKTAESFTDLSLTNSALLPGYAAYLDPYLGFQFLYPEGWYKPTYTEDGLLYTTSPDGSTQLQITLYPNLEPGTTPATLKAQTLAHFGAVDVLFEDTATLGDVQGQRTAYGYLKPDGTPHTGIFFTFVQGNTGFVVDVDGPQTTETGTVETAVILADSWRFAPVGIGLQPGQWTRLNFETFSVARREDFAPQPFNDWQRFIAGPHTFVALRTQPETRNTAEVLSALLRDAANGIPNFTADSFTQIYLGGATWDRADFQYTAEDGSQVWGYIMVKLQDGEEVVAWVEAPASTYNELETAVFLTMIADLTLNQ